MTERLSFPLSVFLLQAAACYAPRDPIIVGDGANEGSTEFGDATTADVSSTTDATSGATADSGDSATTGASTEGGPTCGDGVVDLGEVCDDGANDGSYGGCLPDCTALASHCGDGHVERRLEACDDGNEMNGDGCNNDCVVSGTVLWTETFDGAAHEDDLIDGLAVLPDDEIVAVGYESLSDGQRLAWLRRYAADGTTVWTTTYDGPNPALVYARASSVATDPDGGIYAAGSSLVGGESFNGWAMKYDPDGIPIYLHTFNGASDGADEILGIAVSDGGYVAVAGYESNMAYGWLRRLGQDGSEFWTRTYGGGVEAAGDILFAVAIDSSGNIVAAGQTNVSAQHDAWLRKYTQDGAAVWSRDYDATDEDAVAGVAIDSMDRVVIAGTSTDDNGNSVLFVRQYGADGATLWTETYDQTDITEAAAVAADSEDNVIVVGRVGAEDGLGPKALVGKYGVDGNELWTGDFRIGVPSAVSSTSAASVAIDSQQNIVVGGREVLDDGDLNAWVRKLAP